MTYLKFTRGGVSRLINMYDEAQINEAIDDGFTLQSKKGKPLTVESNELITGKSRASREDVLESVQELIKAKSK